MPLPVASIRPIGLDSVIGVTMTNGQLVSGRASCHSLLLLGTWLSNLTNLLSCHPIIYV